MSNSNASVVTPLPWGHGSIQSDSRNYSRNFPALEPHSSSRAEEYATRLSRLIEQQDIEANTIASVEDELSNTDMLAAEAIAHSTSPLVLECFHVSRQDLRTALIAQSKRHRLFHNRLYIAKRREKLLLQELHYLDSIASTPNPSAGSTPILQPEEVASLVEVQKQLHTSRLHLYQEEETLALQQIHQVCQIRSQLDLGHEDFRRIVKHEVSLPAYLGEPLFLRALEAGIVMDANVALLAAEVHDMEARNTSLWNRFLARLQGHPVPTEEIESGEQGSAKPVSSSQDPLSHELGEIDAPSTLPETLYSNAMARYRCLSRPASSEEAALSRKVERLYHRSRVLAVGDYITILDFLQVWRNVSRAEGRTKLLPLFTPSPHPALITTGLLYRNTIRKQMRKLKSEPESMPSSEWRRHPDPTAQHLPQGGAPMSPTSSISTAPGTTSETLFTNLSFPHTLVTLLEGLPTSRLSPLHPVHARSVWTREGMPTTSSRPRMHAMNTLFLIWGLALRKNPLAFTSKQFSETNIHNPRGTNREKVPTGVSNTLSSVLIGAGDHAKHLVTRFSTLFAPFLTAQAPAFEYPLHFRPLLLPDVCRFPAPNTGKPAYIPATMLFPPATRSILTNVQVGIPEFRPVLESLMNRHPDLQSFLARELPHTTTIVPPSTTTSGTPHPLPHAMHLRNQHARTVFRNRYATMVSAMLLMALGGLDTGYVSGWVLACSCDLLKEPFLRVSVQQVIEGPPFQYNHFWNFVNDFLSAFQYGPAPPVTTTTNSPSTPPGTYGLPTHAKASSQDPSSPHTSLTHIDTASGTDALPVITPYLWPPPHRIAGLFAPDTLALLASQGVDLRPEPGATTSASTTVRTPSRGGRTSRSMPTDPTVYERTSSGRQLSLLKTMEDPLPGADDTDVLSLEMFLRSELDQNQFVVNLAILQRIFDGVPRFLKSGVRGRLCFEDLAWLYAAQVDKMDGGLFSIQEQTTALVQLLRTCEAEFAPAEKQLTAALKALETAQDQKIQNLPQLATTLPGASQSPFPPLAPVHPNEVFAPNTPVTLSQRLRSYLKSPISRSDYDASSIGYWLRCLDMDDDGHVTGDDVQLAYEGKAFSILFDKGALADEDGKLALKVGKGIRYNSIVRPSDLNSESAPGISSDVPATPENVRTLRRELLLVRSCESELAAQLDAIQGRMSQSRDNTWSDLGQKEISALSRHHTASAEKTKAEIVELQGLLREHRERLEQKLTQLRSDGMGLDEDEAMGGVSDATHAASTDRGDGLGVLRNSFSTGLDQEDIGRRQFRHRGGAALAAEDANLTRHNYDELFLALQSQVNQEGVLSYYKTKQLLSSISVPNLLLVVGVSQGISILTHTELMTQIIDLLPPKERSMHTKPSDLTPDTDLRQSDVILSKKYIKEAEIGPQIFDLLISKHVGYWES